MRTNVKKRVSKAFRYLRYKGVRETARRTALYFGRKRKEQLFVRHLQLSEEELTAQRTQEFPGSLLFSIIVPLYNTPMDLLREMIDSVRGQTYDQWELCLADGSDESHTEVQTYCEQVTAEDARIRYHKLEENAGISGNSNAALAMSSGEYIALFDHDDLLLPNALYEMRKAIDQTKADFLYSDELIFQSPNLRRIIGIRLKPQFSPDSLMTNNYICHLTVFSRKLMEKVGGFRSEFDGSQDHDLILRLTNRARGIAHVSKVLYLWRSTPSSVAADINTKTYAIEAGRRAVEDFLRQERGMDATVESTEVFPTMYRVRYPISGEPRVRVILDARKEKGDWAEKVDALRRSAGWDHCEWTVLTGDKKQLEIIPGEVSMLPVREGESRSVLWNRASAEIEEEYLLFIDGVPEAMDPGWVREMLSRAQLPHMGVVGAKVYFQSGDVRHTGVVIGMGLQHVAGRPYYMVEGDNEGYFGQMAVDQNMSAVTDCLMISREKFLAAGGFPEEYQDALFDVDLCLRLLEKGYYNLYTPYAKLKMGRMRDAGFDAGKEYASWPRDAEIFRQRNARFLTSGDPFFHPNLSLKYEDWRLNGP